MFVNRVLLALAVMLIPTTCALAQPASPPAEGQGPRDLLMLRVTDYTLPEALAQLDLTAEQKARVEAIIKETRRERQELTPQQREQLRQERENLQRDLQAARQSGDKQAIQQATQKMREFRQANAEQLGDVRQQLVQVLTPVQRAHLAYLMGPGGRFERLVALVRQLNLTEAQCAQLNQIVEQTRQVVRQRMREEAAGQRPQARRAARNGQAPAESQPAGVAKGPRPMLQAIEQVMDLLTPEQKAELKKVVARRAAQNVLESMLAGLDLTAAQKEKIVDIIAAERAKLGEDATPQDLRQMLQTIRKRIVSEVLTQQQKQILARRHRAGQAQTQP